MGKKNRSSEEKHSPPEKSEYSSSVFNGFVAFSGTAMDHDVTTNHQ